MDLHEYQAKKILKKYGIPVPESAAVATLKEAEYVVDGLHFDKAVIKIQVHAGGREQAGGVKFAKGRTEIFDAVKALLGMRIVNSQTGVDGVVAKTVLVSRPVNSVQEYYLAALVDRARGVAVLMASRRGGGGVEEQAEPFLTLPFSEWGKVRTYHLVALAQFMGWTGDLAEKGRVLAERLCACFAENDASLIEINPLVLDDENELVAVDVKMSIDDRALFRQPELALLFDATQLSPRELMAREAGLFYVGMNGTIGCMANGAGLAMATMDLVRLYGEPPANFLDVGGNACSDRLFLGLKIILFDVHVRAVLINLFAWGLDCELIAEGLIHAVKKLRSTIPLVVRLEGENGAEGREMLKESGLNFFAVESLEEAAQRVVKAGL